MVTETGDRHPGSRYLSAILSKLIRLGSWHKATPLTNVRQIKTDQVELTFLTLDQVA